MDLMDAKGSAPVLYVRIGGIVWVLQADGVFRPLADGEPVNGDIVQAPATLAALPGAFHSDTSLAAFFAQLGRTGSEVIARSGFRTFQYPVFVEHEQPDHPAPVDAIDPHATLTVVIEDGGDGYLNRFEVPLTDIHGTTSNVRDGTPITVTVTDHLGNSLAFATTVSGNHYRLDDRDLSSLADGPLDVRALIEDRYGARVEATTGTDKDTVAIVTAAFVDETVSGGHQGYYSAAEFPRVTLQGTVGNVEDGQRVQVSVSDSAGHVVDAGYAVVSGGQWQLADVDLGSLQPGQLVISASTIDIAGNPASTQSAPFIYDPYAGIDIDTGNGLDIVALRNGTLNSLHGSTANVEAGQTVTLTLSDGVTSVQFSGTTAADGRWTVDGIDVGALDPAREWTLSTAVTDFAGNQAVDATPTIVLPAALTVSESDLAASGSDRANGALNIHGADAVHFAATQNLSGYTSEGSAIVFSVSVDGQTISGARASDGATVLTLSLNADQSVSAVLYKPFDQASGNGANYLDLLANVVATQHDSDGTSESVVAPVTVTIVDTTPLVVDDSGSVVETRTSSGNLLSNDVPYERPYVLTQITVNGSDYAVAAGAPAIVALSEGTLTVSADGSWRFTANRNVDNSGGDHDIRFSYTARDADGDTATATMTLAIEDGTAGVVNGNANLDELSEADVPGTSSHAAGFTVTAGSDDLDAASVRFDNAGNTQLAALDALHLTSNGMALVWSLSSDGQTLRATAGNATVLTLVVSATSASGGDLAGTVTTTWSRPLDHTSSDTLSLPLTIIATDRDGSDATPGDFTLTLNDGADPTLTPDAGISLSEDALTEPNVTTAASGTFAVDPGSDDIARVGFSAAASQPALTSGGDAVTYRISADGRTLTASVDHGGGAQTVFVSTLTGLLICTEN